MPVRTAIVKVARKFSKNIINAFENSVSILNKEWSHVSGIRVDCVGWSADNSRIVK